MFAMGKVTKNPLSKRKTLQMQRKSMLYNKKERDHYICQHEQCNKDFSDLSQLHIHMKEHVQRITYNCDWANCDKSFKQIDELKQHKKVHAINKYCYKCTKCGITYLKLDHLRKHDLELHKVVNTPDNEGSPSSAKEISPNDKDIGNCKSKPKKLITNTEATTSDGKVESIQNQDLLTAVASKKPTCVPCNCSYCLEKKHFDGNRLHICDHDGCSKIYKNPAHLRVHRNLHTREKPYLCSYKFCTKSFKEIDQPIQHKRRHTINKYCYKCTKCGITYLKLDHLRNHDLEVHKDCVDTVADTLYNEDTSSSAENTSSSDNDACSPKFKNVEHNPKAKISNAKDVSQDYLEVNVPNSTDIKIEVRGVFKGKEFKKVETVPEIKKPLDVFKNTKRSKPPPDGKRKRRNRVTCTCSYCMEKKHFDGPKLHICDHDGCNKIYTKTSHLRAHSNLHTGERPYLCTFKFCGMSFTRSDLLSRHRKTHSLHRSVKCNVCGKGFNRSDHLNKHTKSVHKKATSKKDISQSGSTNANTDVINDVLPFEHSAYVAKEGTKVSDPLVEVKKEKDSKTSFVLFAILNPNSKVHKSQKPHTCEDCGKTFHRADNLEKHAKNVHKKETAKETDSTNDKTDAANDGLSNDHSDCEDDEDLREIDPLLEIKEDKSDKKRKLVEGKIADETIPLIKSEQLEVSIKYEEDFDT